MATLGEELREAREKKGLTLEQIAETTRISHTFLKALEEDNYTVIPGDVFVTGFLRSYARELGIDEKHVLARYRDVHPQHNEEAQPAAPQAAEVQHFPKPSLLRIRRAHHPANKKTSLYFIILGGLLLAKAPEERYQCAQGLLDDPTLYIPAVHRDYSTSSVLTTEFVEGIKISSIELLDAAGYDRRALCARGADIALAPAIDATSDMWLARALDDTAPSSFVSRGRSLADELPGVLPVVVRSGVDAPRRPGTAIITVAAIGPIEPDFEDRPVLGQELTELITVVCDILGPAVVLVVAVPG